MSRSSEYSDGLDRENTPKSPNHLDDKILNFSQEQAPEKSTWLNRYWLSAASVCSIFLVTVLYVTQPSEVNDLNGFSESTPTQLVDSNAAIFEKITVDKNEMTVSHNLGMMADTDSLAVARMLKRERTKSPLPMRTKRLSPAFQDDVTSIKESSTNQAGTMAAFSIQEDLSRSKEMATIDEQVLAVAKVEKGYTLYFTRHAEKVANQSRDPKLTKQGEQRALSLASYLSQKDITTVYSTDYKRTRFTAAPSASQFGLDITIYNPSKLAVFAEQLKAKAENALVVGHSNTTPALIRLLVNEELSINESEYGQLFIIEIIGEVSVFSQSQIVLDFE